MAVGPVQANRVWLGEDGTQEGGATARLTAPRPTWVERLLAVTENLRNQFLFQAYYPPVDVTPG